MRPPSVRCAGCRKRRPASPSARRRLGAQGPGNRSDCRAPQNAEVTPAGLVRAKLLEVLSGQPAGIPEWTRALSGGEDAGYFEPDSAVWTVHRDIATLVAGPRALLMQALHPGAMAGVHDHSRYREDPFGRLDGTIRWITTVSFGSTGQARGASAWVSRIHERVRGTYLDASGRPGALRGERPRPAVLGAPRLRRLVPPHPPAALDASHPGRRRRVRAGLGARGRADGRRGPAPVGRRARRAARRGLGERRAPGRRPRARRRALHPPSAPAAGAAAELPAAVQRRRRGPAAAGAADARRCAPRDRSGSPRPGGCSPRPPRCSVRPRPSGRPANGSPGSRAHSSRSAAARNSRPGSAGRSRRAEGDPHAHPHRTHRLGRRPHGRLRPGRALELGRRHLRGVVPAPHRRRRAGGHEPRGAHRRGPLGLLRHAALRRDRRGRRHAALARREGGRHPRPGQRRASRSPAS